MFHFSRLFIFCSILFSLVFSVSCSRSRSALKKAEYCPTKYNPITFSSNDFKEKIVMKKGEELSLSSGQYEYVSSEFYYYNKARDIRIHYRHSRTSSEKDSKEVKCIGGKGIKSGMEAVQFQIPFISSITSNTSGRGMISEGLSTLSIKPHSTLPWLSHQINDKSSEKKEGSMKDLYPEYESEQIFAAMKKDNLFEYRARLKEFSDNKSDINHSVADISVLVTYKFIPNK